MASGVEGDVQATPDGNHIEIRQDRDARAGPGLQRAESLAFEARHGPLSSRARGSGRRIGVTNRHRGGTGLAGIASPAAAPARRIGAGAAVFRQGDPATAVYIVESGRIRLVRHLADGSLVSLHTAREGDAFAEASLWSEVYHCDAVAEVPSRVLALPKPDLLRSLETDQAACLAFARLMAEQVRELRARLELRNIRSAPERVLAWLRVQAAGVPGVVPLDRTWSAVAEDLGLTKEAVYRALAALERAGEIRREAKRVVLRDTGI